MKTAFAGSALAIATLLCGNAPGLAPLAAVGSQVESVDRVPGVPRGPCTPTDCEVQAHDGSRWTIFGKTVTRQRYLASVSGSLPFGLADVAGRDQSLRLVRGRTGVRFMPAGHRTYDGPVRLQNGLDAILYVKLGTKGSVDEIGVTIGEGE